MPKSKLRTNMGINEVEGIQATRERIDVESVVVNNRLIKRPKFIQAQINPGFRSIGSIETDEVEYDSYIKWAVSKIVQRWIKAFGGSADDYLYDVKVADNGDIIVAGTTYSFGAGDADVLVIRLDPNGDVKWTKAYGGSSEEYAYKVAIADNDDIIIAGYTYSFGAGGRDILAIRLDPNGDVKWARAYGGGSQDEANGVAVDSKNDIILAGSTLSFGSGNGDMFVVKVDQDGNVEWAKVYVMESNKSAHDVVVADNDDIIVVADGVVLRLDQDGNLKWAKEFDSDHFIDSVRVAPNGDIIVCGYSCTLGDSMGDALIIRLDQDGNLKWAKKFGWDGIMDESHSIAVADNGDILSAGYTYNPSTDVGDILVFRLDQDGNLKWSKTYGGKNSTSSSSITIADNGDIIASGATNGFGAGNSDGIVLRLDSNGNTSVSVINVTDVNLPTADVSTAVTVSDTSPSVTSVSPTVTAGSLVVTSVSLVVTDL